MGAHCLSVISLQNLLAKCLDMITACGNCTPLRGCQPQYGLQLDLPHDAKEECSYEALAHVFNKYFTDTNRINTSEDYLNFGWAAPLFTESDWSTMKHHTKKMHL